MVGDVGAVLSYVYVPVTADEAFPAESQAITFNVTSLVPDIEMEPLEVVPSLQLAGAVPVVV